MSCPSLWRVGLVKERINHIQITDLLKVIPNKRRTILFFFFFLNLFLKVLPASFFLVLPLYLLFKITFDEQLFSELLSTIGTTYDNIFSSSWGTQLPLSHILIYFLFSVDFSICSLGKI